MSDGIPPELEHQLEHELSKRGLSRRQFLRGGAAAAGAVGLGALFAACGDGEAVPETSATTAPAAETTMGETTATTVGTTAPVGAPKRGGTIRFAAASGINGFDPHRWWDGFTWAATTAYMDQILGTTEQGALAPGLAELPEVTNDGTLHTFKLRPGVMFHHGREMTSDDAKFSLDRLLRPATGNAGASLYDGLPIVGLEDVLNERANEVSGIKVIDGLTFSIELEQPESALAYTLTLPFASIVPRDVVEEMGDEQFNLTPVGNGPFVLKDVDLENSLVLERFPDYWNPQYPYVDRVEWTIGTDPDLAALQVQRGELDMIQVGLSPGNVQQLRDDPGENGQITIGPINVTHFMTVNQTYGPFQDIRVRRAVAMALDRDRLVRTLQGIPFPQTGGLFTSLTSYYQDGLAYPYDPDGARTLLAEAGADGIEVLIQGRSITPHEEMAQTVQADLQAIGVNATADIATPEVYDERVYAATDKPPMVAALWGLPYPHGSYFMDAAFTQKAFDAGCCNMALYLDPDFDELARQAHVAQDPEEIADLYKQMDKKLVQDDIAAVPMIQASRVEFYSKRIQGFVVPAAAGGSTHSFRDYWIE